MNVLVACECSGKVREAFRSRGHNSWSNDLQPADDGSEYHYHGDCFEAIKAQKWDLIIMHPPCTCLAVSGNRWYGKGMPRHQDRLDSIQWTMRLWDTAVMQCERVAMENPVGVIPMQATQYIQPWEFGHGETKKTGLWLHGLPALKPTNIVDGREQRIWKMGPSADRAKVRSETYQGIADAMAEQWACVLQEQGDE